MFKNIIKLGTFAALVALVFGTVSCKKDDEDEAENINLIKVTVAGRTFSWADTDGAGGAAPVIDTIILPLNASNTAEIAVLDGSVTPNKDFTTEIKAESADHLFVYRPSGLNLTVSSLSKDSNNKDFGQTAVFASGGQSSGTLQIVLKHLADKNAANPATTGETDFDIVFPIVIR